MTHCLTPGCRYRFRIRTEYAHSSYGNASIDALVLFPSWQSLAIRTEQQLKFADEILHRHMEAAVAEIGRYDLSLGGAIAKDWPTNIESGQTHEHLPLQPPSHPREHETQRHPPRWPLPNMPARA